MSSARTRVVLVAVTLFLVAVYGGSVFLAGVRDRPDRIDDRPVADAASAACTSLRVDVDALPPLPPTATADDRRARVAEQGRALQRFQEQVRAVGQQALADDPPALDWLGDWQRLADARQAWADAGATGPFTVPEEPGRAPLVQRMEGVGLSLCKVPAPLLTAP